jgi:hypothetical protein
MRKILLTGKLSNGNYAIVDDDIILPKRKWSLTWNGYAIAQINGKCHTMQGWIMQTPKGMETDHLNGNKLDNRRENLQICTSSLNNQRRLQNKHLKHQGIHWYKQTKRWRASLQAGGKVFHLGYFLRLNDAIDIYNKKAREIYGEMARLNSYPAR